MNFPIEERQRREVARSQVGGLNNETKRLWEELTGQALSDEDVREIASNLTAFFDLLHEWDQAARNCADNSHPATEPVTPSESAPGRRNRLSVPRVPTPSETPTEETCSGPASPREDGDAIPSLNPTDPKGEQPEQNALPCSVRCFNAADQGVEYHYEEGDEK